MGYHHLAVAVHDMKAIDAFYSQAMGFDLVKVEVAPTPSGEGIAKHFFYETGGGEMMAFWELHDPTLPQDFPTGLSTAAGLPEWVNHYAFSADGPDDLQKRKQRLLDSGYDVLEIDHHWCYSIYTKDPNGTLVEFCITTAEFDGEDHANARRALRGEEIPGSQPPVVTVHRTEAKPVHERA
jgi:catechol 2,3-dioxygenase-like lactoylglutathione lyase family enzyme